MNPKVAEIVNQLKPYKPEKIILFGSYAYGNPGEYSDVDLIVVKKTDKPFHERQIEARMLLEIETPLDIFIFTPEEFEKHKNTNLFLREASTKGKVIYG